MLPHWEGKQYVHNSYQLSLRDVLFIGALLHVEKIASNLLLSKTLEVEWLYKNK